MALDIFTKDYIRDVKFKLDEVTTSQSMLDQLYKQKKDIENKIKWLEGETTRRESEARRSVMMYKNDDKYDYSLFVKGNKMVRVRKIGYDGEGVEVFTAEKVDPNTKGAIPFDPNSSARKMGAKETIWVSRGKPLKLKFKHENAARLWFSTAKI